MLKDFVDDPSFHQRVSARRGKEGGQLVLRSRLIGQSGRSASLPGWRAGRADNRSAAKAHGSPQIFMVG